MATSTLEFTAPQGLTLTAQLFALGADTELIAATATERTNDKGSYTCSIVDIASGTYRLRIKNAANNTIARGFLDHVNATGTEYPNESGGARIEPPQGAPGATISAGAKLDYLYKAWRNKKAQTASQYILYNDDAATIDHKAAVSDDGTTTTVGEVATGP